MRHRPSEFKPVRMLPHEAVPASRRRRRKPPASAPTIEPKTPPVPSDLDPVEDEQIDDARTYWIWMWLATCGVAAAAYILGLL